jgi:hypothetical protein
VTASAASTPARSMGRAGRSDPPQQLPARAVGTSPAPRDRRGSNLREPASAGVATTPPRLVRWQARRHHGRLRTGRGAARVSRELGSPQRPSIRPAQITVVRGFSPARRPSQVREHDRRHRRFDAPPHRFVKGSAR